MAGTGSLALRLTAYGGRDDNLFVGGTAESAFFPTQPLVSELEFQFERFARALGVLVTLTSWHVYVRRVPLAMGPPAFYFTPCIDGDFTQDYPILLFEQGKFIRRLIIFGDDENEGSIEHLSFVVMYVFYSCWGS